MTPTWAAMNVLRDTCLIIYANYFDGKDNERDASLTFLRVPNAFGGILDKFGGILDKFGSILDVSLTFFAARSETLTTEQQHGMGEIEVLEKENFSPEDDGPYLSGYK